jgi:hypothetical protein
MTIKISNTLPKVAISLTAFALILLVWTPSAKADSQSSFTQFVGSNQQTVSCSSVDQDVSITVTFVPGTETRIPRATVMEIADPNVAGLRQHIATIRASEGFLDNYGSTVVALIDTNNPSHKPGKRIGGTVLSALYSIAINIDFSFTPNNGQRQYSAQTIYTKRTGEKFSQDFVCVSL